MRKIKFREWNRFAKVMDYKPYGGDFLNSIQSGKYGQGINLMQYTGLKDKNGNEIYEGDIVGTHEDKDNLDYDENPSKWILVVEWNGEEAKWDIKDTEVITTLERLYEDQWHDDFCGINKDNMSTLEVIGNIYENKELLT